MPQSLINSSDTHIQSYRVLIIPDNTIVIDGPALVQLLSRDNDDIVVLPVDTLYRQPQRECKHAVMNAKTWTLTVSNEVCIRIFDDVDFWIPEYDRFDDGDDQNEILSIFPCYSLNCGLLALFPSVFSISNRVQFHWRFVQPSQVHTGLADRVVHWVAPYSLQWHVAEHDAVLMKTSQFKQLWLNQQHRPLNIALTVQVWMLLRWWWWRWRRLMIIIRLIIMCIAFIFSFQIAAMNWTVRREASHAVLAKGEKMSIHDFPMTDSSLRSLPVMILLMIAILMMF